jgi:hypothetical protein
VGSGVCVGVDVGSGVEVMEGDSAIAGETGVDVRVGVVASMAAAVSVGLAVADGVGSGVFCTVTTTAERDSGVGLVGDGVAVVAADARVGRGEGVESCPQATSNSIVVKTIIRPTRFRNAGGIVKPVCWPDTR